MSVRVLGATLVVLLLGAAGGWGYAATRTDEPVPIAAEPLPAQDPRLPVETMRPEPDDPALSTGIPLRFTTLVLREKPVGPPARRLRLEVPRGWIVSRPSLTRWSFRPPGLASDAYGLRVDLYAADETRTVEAANQSRASELRSAASQRNIEDLEIEDAPDGFVATYVNADGYRENSVQRFFSGPEPQVVYATIAATGRLRDLAGLSDLVERMTITLRTG